ncbi:hypothetical protein Lesp02_65290 [Lentzea sp. NBRC 105346]|uniref:SgcJ/EcaC family oxidoreductase n=1 Tax=Lentzea sp. NBRC 105346 TaxID=3032205 RepID=UPI0024A26E97|nr:SgcJ/EcaC family oxidoreductase [Lentzea sp. NBRC 105346]GLZ34342.1 hypothetical protein Lesp02_65290 [Lentzea sp. NBRC 105346]
MNDIAAIKDLLDRHRAAWDAGDGDVYAASWTADGTYTTWLGSAYRGREDIGRSHQALFDSFLKGTVMTLQVQDIQFYGSDTAVVTSLGDVGKKVVGKPSKVQTYTVVRQDGEWLIAAFQNTKRAALREAISFKLQPATKPRG